METLNKAAANLILLIANPSSLIRALAHFNEAKTEKEYEDRKETLTMEIIHQLAKLNKQ